MYSYIYINNQKQKKQQQPKPKQKPKEKYTYSEHSKSELVINIQKLDKQRFLEQLNLRFSSVFVFLLER